MIQIRKADGMVEFVRTPEEFKREKLLEYLESLVKEQAKKGDKRAQALLSEIEDYVIWFSQITGRSSQPGQ